MVLNRRVARFNRHFANHLVGPVLARLPGFGTVHHVGRRSGRAYATPVKLFRLRGDYVIALPYGPSSDWVRNVLAAGHCDVVARGCRLRLGEPRLVSDHGIQLPALTRAALRRLDATHFLALTPADQGIRPGPGARTKE
jgi:deazaflavin-dependent oxidoreductase (nitroreductase family)